MTAMTTDPSCPAPGGDAPLVALLGRAEAAYAAEFDRRLRSSPFCALSLAHSRNVLQYLTEGPRRASQIVSQCDVTKQAVSQQITHLERQGYLITVTDPTDRRARLLRLTDHGIAAQKFVSRLFEQIDAEWETRLGGTAYAALRASLTDLPARSCR